MGDLLASNLFLYLYFVKRKRIYAVFLILISWCATSCDSVIEPPADMGFNYFPLKPGMYIIYDVDSFYIDCQYDIYDTLHFQLKEKLDTFFIDGTGKPAMRIERYARNNSSSNWQIRDVWWADTLSTRAIKTEENMKYVKLIFPPIEGEQWNGNAYNSITDWNFLYRYESVDKPYSIGVMNFDSTASVLQQSIQNLLTYKYQVEKYARHIGLIYRIKIDVEGISNSNPTLYDPCEEKLPTDILWTQVPIMQRIKIGSYWEQRIQSYGIE